MHGRLRATPTSNTNATTSIVNPSFIKRLNRAEMAERHAKGLCCNCDKQFTPSHRYKRLFWLEVEDKKDVREELELDISLHALIRVKNRQTVQIKAEISRTTVLILVDSNSTYNFISKLETS